MCAGVSFMHNIIQIKCTKCFSFAQIYFNILSWNCGCYVLLLLEMLTTEGNLSGILNSEEAQVVIALVCSGGRPILDFVADVKTIGD